MQPGVQAGSQANSRTIPSLDGLRAVSVLMVISAHVNGALARLIPYVPFWIYLGWGALGVQTFFVISGFLITHLLLRELQSSGTISLKHFYFRRSLRIFPAFYVYLAVAGMVTLAGWQQGSLRGFLVAATYTWNYLGGGSELLEHTWSLSLEEQFYLLWPAALLLLGTRKSSKLAVWVILLSPLSRIATYYLAPNHRSLINGMLHTGLDSIMFGCLLAILWRNPRFNQIVQPIVRGWTAALAAFLYSGAGAGLSRGPLPRLVHLRIRLYSECRLSFAHSALCGAQSRVRCRTDAQYPGAASPRGDLL